MCYAKGSREFMSLFKCQESEETATFSRGYHCSFMVSLLTFIHCFCSLTIKWKSLPGEHINSFKKALRKSPEHTASWRWLPWCLGRAQKLPSPSGKISLCASTLQQLSFILYSVDVVILSKWNKRRRFLNQPIYLIRFKKHFSVSQKYPINT